MKKNLADSRPSKSLLPTFSTSSTVGGSSTAPKMFVRDWRQALRTPPTYRIGNRTFRFHFHIGLMIFALGALIFVFLYVKPASKSYSDNWLVKNSQTYTEAVPYNYTYPLTAAIISNGLRTYRIGVIADMDTASKSPKDSQIWHSYLKKGRITYNGILETVTVSWDDDDPIELSSSYALKGRGMELSELVTYNGRILTFDDRTGLIYELIQNKVLPWIILTDGDGRTTKGFKSEWATVKDKALFVGSMGKEWTTSQGDFENEYPMYVKEVSVNGEVKHLNWADNFKKIRSVLGISWPGYMIHESGMWSHQHQKWYFLPRRCSKERYNETRDEHMGCNSLITADENFIDIQETKIGKINPTHGYSTFKFIPGTDDKVIVAVKTEEVNGRTSSFLSVFTVSGKIILNEEKIPTDLKYEGLEFL